MRAFFFFALLIVLSGCYNRSTKSHVIDEKASELKISTQEKQSEYKYSNEIFAQIENQSFDSLKTIAMPDGTVKTIIYGGNKRIQSSNQISIVDTTKNELLEIEQAFQIETKAISNATETAVNSSTVESKKETNKSLMWVGIIALLILIGLIVVKLKK